MVNLLPLTLVPVAPSEVLGEAHQGKLLCERAQSLALWGVVAVAHHDEVWRGALAMQ